MARSLVAIILDIPADSFDVDVEVGKVGTVQVAERAARLRAARQTATRLEREVQTDAESLARDLANEGLPLPGIGDILGISYQRAHQLVAH